MINPSPDGTIRVKFMIPKDFSSAGSASSGLKKLLKSIGVSPDIIRKASVASFEAEVNVIAHANGGEMDIMITPQRLIVMFKDNGPGIPDIDQAMKPGFSTASDEVRNMGFGAGMGLPNIKNNTDDLSISTELGVGTIVTFAILLNGAAS
ncbi:MAG: ATP-binding protein [Candidatus Delongbacteria bacterium]|nr:ATP-binding protein [Candidatus Delongbacteria bacterium]